MANPNKVVLVQEDLGINFNGYPLENVMDDNEFIEKVELVLRESFLRRLQKNLDYELVVEVREKTKDIK